MYKRILIPTDGSPLARKAIKEGVALAKSVGASVIGYTAVEPIERIYYSEGAGIRAAQVKAIEKQLHDQGAQYVEQIRKAATAAGVASEVVMTKSPRPYQGIIDAARKQRCDVICMASHGRGNLASAVLGNVTQKVLTHSKIPVLVFR
jgi:nucleotide-binding universal stress UspA family protein